MSDFVHLHLHTTYSLLDGQCQINPLVLKARKLGMKALAVTDHGNLFALKSFYDACRSTKKQFADIPKIKPILGCEAYVVDHDYLDKSNNKEKRFHLCLHAKNMVGYHNLVRLISEAHINGFYGRPRIDHTLLEKYHEGLHCSSACIAGEVSYYLDNSLKGGNSLQKAEETAKWYKELFGDDYSLEVMLHPPVKAGADVPDRAKLEFKDLYQRQLKIVSGMLALGKKLDIRVIATNDVHFLEKEDDDSHDVLLALSTGKKMSDEGRMIYTGQEYFKTEEEMRELFKENPELITNTLEVAEKIEEYELDSPPIMPKFEIPASFGTEADIAKKYDEATLEGMYPPGRMKKLGGYDKVVRIQFEAEYLASLTWDGAKKRWGNPLPKETEERVSFELETIRTMGFPGYFLIVRDYIRAAREECDTWVGPGRGSAAGSAVAYALWITNIDPLKYDLLFERFLNPDRISMPDIDVDFDDAGRERVIDYVTRKYGADHVAHIVTFGQMAAKSAIKDVGRVMEYPLRDTNKLASYVPDTPKIDFSTAMRQTDKKGKANKDYSPDLVAAFNSEDPTIHKLMERAARLEGCIRQPGVHACGMLISRDPLIETLPVMPTPEKGGSKKAKSDAPKADKLLTTQYDGHFVEPVGLLKMDFLGLKTLTVEKECVALLGKRNPRVPEALWNDAGELDTDKIPDDDKETYELFGRGETTGLFQFESPGMKKWLIALQPEKLTDLVAMNALYRPGPMDYIPTFVARKQGDQEIVYDHPLMEKYLKDTYGVCVYQEQVMLLSRLLAGFTRGESDKLRKAMGKKLMDIMAELKEKFIKGCLANPEFRIDKWKDEETAKKLINKIWKDWEAFASYAFNKSHAVCYAWVAYQTGYLKAHYPAEFMCAQISSEIGNFDKLPGFVAEAQSIIINGEPMRLLLPDVNESGARFVPTADSRGIRYGLGGIKGVGSAAAEAIIAEREKNGPYKGFMDFCMRLASSNVINKRVLENLTRTGAFSTIEPNRSKLFNNIEFALKNAQQRAKEKNSAQTSFFDIIDEGSNNTSDAALRDFPPFAPAEDLKNERDLLGVYVSGDPLAPCRRLIEEVSILRIDRKPVENSSIETLPFSLSMIARKAEEKADSLENAEAEEISVETIESTSDNVDASDEVESLESSLSIEQLLLKSDEKDWILKGLARRAVRAQNLASSFDKAALDKAIAKMKSRVRKNVDKVLLRKLDIRIVGVLSACTIKVSKPRPDGTMGPKWALLTLEDGTGFAETAAFGNVWSQYGDKGKIAERIDQLVLVCGELAHKPVFAKEDASCEHPTVGDLSLTVKEVYPLEEALPLISKGLRIKMNYEDPEIKRKVNAIRDSISRSPGQLPVLIDLKYPSGRVVKVDLGAQFKVAINISFLSELSKIVTQADITFEPDDRLSLAPPRDYGF